MKNSLYILFLILGLISCKNESKNELDKTEITTPQFQETEAQEFTISEIDSLYFNGELIKKSFPSMSACGGGLYGFYFKDDLKLIDSKYQAELGFTSKKIYWNRNKILKIKYREYAAEWGKYEKKYPQKEFKYDPSKMTYSDTIYEIAFGDKIEFRKTSKKKIISKKLDTTLIKKLIDCGERMKEELESISDFNHNR